MALLREIPKQPNCPDLDATDEDKLSSLCFDEMPLDDADLIFVFGNNVQHYEQARLAAALCERHPRASLVLTGGQPNYSENLGANRVALAESDALHLELAKRTNLERREVIMERKSQNTLENVTFAVEHIRSVEPKKVIFLSQSFALGRSAMTFRAVLPEIGRIGSLGMDRYVGTELLSSDNWRQSAILRDIVWGEFLRMVTYSARGDIDAGAHSLLLSQLAAKYLTT